MPIAALDSSFVFKTALPQAVAEPPGPTSDPLQALVGVWAGTGFNAIWRPDSTPGQDRFLMLNLTDETLTFSRIAGTIPNRGLLQGDISMTGVTYMDQIADTAGNGMHIEPGIWAVVPATTNPGIPQSVVRMASIPHGTTILAQGTASDPVDGAPTIPAATLVPTQVGGTQTVNFPELDLSQPSDFRTNPLPDEINQALVDDPNGMLRSNLVGLTVSSTTTLTVRTDGQPVAGGGTANTAFLEGTDPDHEHGNAFASLVSARFWIETVAAQGDRPGFMQLQYSQTVQLDFNGLSWPHVTVATLRQMSAGPTPTVPLPPRVGA